MSSAAVYDTCVANETQTSPRLDKILRGGLRSKLLLQMWQKNNVSQGVIPTPVEPCLENSYANCTRTSSLTAGFLRLPVNSRLQVWHSSGTKKFSNREALPRSPEGEKKEKLLTAEDRLSALLMKRVKNHAAFKKELQILLWEELRDCNEDVCEHLCTLGQVVLRLGRHAQVKEDAALCFKLALESRPDAGLDLWYRDTATGDRRSVWLRCGNLLSAAGKLSEAIAIYRAGLAAPSATPSSPADAVLSSSTRYSLEPTTSAPLSRPPRKRSISTPGEASCTSTRHLLPLGESSPSATSSTPHTPCTPGDIPEQGQGSSFLRQGSPSSTLQSGGAKMENTSLESPPMSSPWSERKASCGTDANPPASPSSPSSPRTPTTSSAPPAPASSLLSPGENGEGRVLDGEERGNHPVSQEDIAVEVVVESEGEGLSPRAKKGEEETEGGSRDANMHTTLGPSKEVQEKEESNLGQANVCEASFPVSNSSGVSPGVTSPGARQTPSMRARILVNLGVALEARAQLPEARDAYLQALTECPQYPAALKLLGGVQLGLGLPGLARDSLLTAVRLEPGFSAAWADLGAAERLLGDYQGAADKLTRALDLDPTQVRARWQLGCCLRDLGQYPAAQAHFTSVLRTQPDTWPAHVHHALCTLLQGEKHCTTTTSTSTSTSTSTTRQGGNSQDCCTPSCGPAQSPGEAAALADLQAAALKAENGPASITTVLDMMSHRPATQPPSPPPSCPSTSNSPELARNKDASSPPEAVTPKVEQLTEQQESLHTPARTSAAHREQKGGTMSLPCEVREGFERLKLLWDAHQSAVAKARQWHFPTITASIGLKAPESNGQKPPQPVPVQGRSYVHFRSIAKAIPSGISIRKKMRSSAGGFQVVLNLDDSSSSETSRTNSESFPLVNPLSIPDKSEDTFGEFHTADEHSAIKSEDLEAADKPLMNMGSLHQYFFDMNPMCSDSVRETSCDYMPYDVFPSDFETQAFTFETDSPPEAKVKTNVEGFENAWGEVSSVCPSSSDCSKAERSDEPNARAKDDEIDSKDTEAEAEELGIEAHSMMPEMASFDPVRREIRELSPFFVRFSVDGSPSKGDGSPLEDTLRNEFSPVRHSTEI